MAAFAPIAGGWFTMGTDLGHEDERPPHRVFVAEFELGVYPQHRVAPASDRVRRHPTRDSP